MTDPVCNCFCERLEGTGVHAPRCPVEVARIEQRREYEAAAYFNDLYWSFVTGSWMNSGTSS